LAGVGELVAGLGEPVGVCAGLDDVAAEGEPVDDRGGYLDFDLEIWLLSCGFMSWTGVLD
jgi:hypothetical protein